MRESLKDVRLSDEEDEEMEEDKPKSKLPAKEPVNVTVENYSSSLNSILCSCLSLALCLTPPLCYSLTSLAPLTVVLCHLGRPIVHYV